MQRFPGRLWGVGDACGEWQAVPSAWLGRDFVVGGVCRCPSDLAVVVPFHRPPGVPVFEDCNQNLLEHLLSYPDLLDLRHFSTRIFHSTALQ